MFCFILLQHLFYFILLHMKPDLQQNKINAATILKSLAGLSQHALILFYCT